MSAVDSPAIDAARLGVLCRESAAEAAAMLVSLRRRGSVQVTGTKTSSTDIVTSADSEAEELLRRILLGARPGDGWLGEETGQSYGTAGGDRVTWVVDPIDGTVNYLYDLPGWAVSVAASVDNEVVAGAVASPTTGEIFSAYVGGGAWCNDDRLQASSATSLSQALVATGFSYDAQKRAAQGRAVGKLLPMVRDIRRQGAAAVDLCSVAAGRVDAYFERGTKPWDRAAGCLMASEAGAVVVEDDEGGLVVAGPRLVAVLLTTLKEVGA